MKRISTLIAIFILLKSFSYGQWLSGGTQVSLSPDFHHRPWVTAGANGSSFIMWQATDTTASSNSSIRLSSYDATGTLRAGWLPGGDTISKPGDFFGPQLFTSEDGNIIVAWYGYPAGSNRSQIYVQKYTPTGMALWNGGNPVQVSAGTSYIN